MDRDTTRTGEGPSYVLLVDDEETFRRSLAEGISLLSGGRFEPVGVGSVDEALQALQTRPFTALVTDIRMPGKDGLQLLLEMKRRSIRVPTLVITAYGSPAVHAQAARSGAVRYIEKPFPLEHLMDFLEYAAAQAGTERVRTLDLIEVVEMLCLGGRDMKVGVRTRDVQGTIFVKGGEIVHCETDDHRTGVDVLMELFALPSPQISTTPGEEPLAITIDQPWRELTEEAWRRRTLARPVPPLPPRRKEPLVPPPIEEEPSLEEAVREVAQAPEPGLAEEAAVWFWERTSPQELVEELTAFPGVVRPGEVVGLDERRAALALHTIATGLRLCDALGAGLLLGVTVRKPGGTQVIVPIDDLHAAWVTCHAPAVPERRLYARARRAPSWRTEGRFVRGGLP